MAETEKISGDGVARLFKVLLQRKTLLKLILLDTDFQYPTIVTALTDQKTGPCFIIETPEGFREAAADIDSWRIRFEFTGNDNIRYAFNTIGGEIIDNRIIIKLPESIAREQRRKLFRINAPDGTRLCFTIDSVRYEFEVIDISIGGTLAAMVQTASHVYKEPPFPDIGELKDVELVFPVEICQQPIKIKTAKIRRTKKNPDATYYEMALEFSKIDIHQEGLLTDQIYRLQRQHLRKRLPLDI